MRSDSDITAAVAEELFWETRVDDEEVAVSVRDGRVTLRGTVGSLGAKHAATNAARRVSGVRGVDNELQVKLMTEHRRDDAELRGTVLKALSWNVLVPDDVDATVKDGVVTLSGIVDFRHQRDEAPLTAAAVGDGIEKAFRRSAQIDADNVQVRCTNPGTKGVAEMPGVDVMRDPTLQDRKSVV